MSIGNDQYSIQRVEHTDGWVIARSNYSYEIGVFGYFESLTMVGTPGYILGRDVIDTTGNALWNRRGKCLYLYVLE